LLPTTYRNISNFHLLDAKNVLTYGFYPFVESGEPQYNPLTHKLVKTLVLSNNEVSYSYSVEQMNEQEVAAVFQSIRDQLNASLDAYLDAVVQTKGFKNILSACTYANSSNLTNKALGETVVDWRDSVWAVVDQIQSDVINGLRFPPTEAELLQELPEIVWPQ